jgi:hypothetical protein
MARQLEGSNPWDFCPWPQHACAERVHGYHIFHFKINNRCVSLLTCIQEDTQFKPRLWLETVLCFTVFLSPSRQAIIPQLGHERVTLHPIYYSLIIPLFDTTWLSWWQCHYIKCKYKWKTCTFNLPPYIMSRPLINTLLLYSDFNTTFQFLSPPQNRIFKFLKVKTKVQGIVSNVCPCSIY